MCPLFKGLLLNNFFKIVDENVNDDQSIEKLVFWINFIHEQAMLNEFWSFYEWKMVHS